MNLVLAVLVSVVLIALAKTGHISQEWAEMVIRFMVVLNISLMFFNLLPKIKRFAHRLCGFANGISDGFHRFLDGMLHA